ncbi:MAG: hypothetical protein IIY22_04100 [Erysipelotrichaceae bacterium]|jgi:cellobiose phosphorylase|nr:hypothetical protein [Erysipelotrichaceae bacterium]
MYHITVKNENGSQKGVKQVVIDGKPIEEKIIPVSKKKDVNVEIIM